MSYVPLGATPAQLQQFAHRLAHHLGPRDARKGLMSVQTAFARAGGYPDRHAAEVSAGASLLSSNPLLALGHANGRVSHTHGLFGIKAHQLLEWGRHAWKKQKTLLAKPDFSEKDAQALLAVLWRHKHWNSVLSQPQSSDQTPDNASSDGLLCAGSLDNLIKACAKAPLNTPNFGGLYAVLGQTDEGNIVGLDTKRALGHILAIDDNQARRHATAKRWVRERAMAGDGIIVVDGSDASVVLAVIDESGRGKEALVIDWREDHRHIPGIDRMDTSSLADLVINATGNGYWNHATQDHGKALSWIIYACHRFVQRRQDGYSTDFQDLINGMGNPQTNLAWWGEDSIKEAQARWENVPENWNRAYDTLQTLARTTIADLKKDEQYHEAFEHQHPIVIQLPHPSHVMRDICERMILPLLKGKLSEGMSSMRLKTPDGHLTPEARPTLALFLDVPLGCGARGGAVIPAQVRGLGWVLAHMSAQYYLDPQSEEANAWMGNMNTKISYGLGDFKFASANLEGYKAAGRENALSTIANYNIKIFMKVENSEDAIDGYDLGTGSWLGHQVGQDTAAVLSGQRILKFRPE